MCHLKVLLLDSSFQQRMHHCTTLFFKRNAKWIYWYFSGARGQGLWPLVMLTSPRVRWPWPWTQGKMNVFCNSFGGDCVCPKLHAYVKDRPTFSQLRCMGCLSWCTFKAVQIISYVWQILVGTFLSCWRNKKFVHPLLSKEWKNPLNLSWSSMKG